VWAFREDFAICLLGGWEIAGPVGHITTSVEQCRLRQSADVATSDAQIERLHEGAPARDNVRWILHHGIGYAPLEESKMHVRLARAQGTWHDINRQYGSEAVSEPVFRVTIDHGANPKPGGYVIVLDADAKRMADLQADSAWEVMCNTAHCQSIRFKDGPTMAAFYSPADVPIGKLRVSRPCLAIWTEDCLWLCDPTHRGTEIAVVWKGRRYLVALPPQGAVLPITLGSNAR
jgi:chondroitin AC lyase